MNTLPTVSSNKLYEFMFDNQIPFTYPMYSERSLMKKIDILHLRSIKNLIKREKLRLTIRYRGNSYDGYRRNPSYVLMNNAQTFAIYEKEKTVTRKATYDYTRNI